MTPASTARWTYSSARRIPSDETPADSGGPGVSDGFVIAGSIPTPSSPTPAYAVRMAAALARSSSAIAASRSLNFWTLPDTVIGKLSTSFQ